MDNEGSWPNSQIINSQFSILHSPLLSAIVLNYRSHRDTVRCARALLEQSIGHQMEVLVIDNHSDDESMGFIRSQLKDPRVRILENRGNIGYGRGNNAAVTWARGEYLLIVNPDNVLPHDAAEKMLHYLETHDDVGMVGPALVFPDGTIRPSARPFPRIGDLVRKRLFPKQWHGEFQHSIDAMLNEKEVDVDWLVGACLMMRTDLYRTLGGFDERYFLFFEDIDLCRRLHGLGKRVVYLPKVHVLDRKGRLSGSSIFSLLTRKTTRIHLGSALKYFRKWGFGVPKTA